MHLALVSGEHAADALNIVLDQPKQRPKLFKAYEKRLNRVMDLYLRFVNAWYRHEFAEVLSQPTERRELRWRFCNLVANAALLPCRLSPKILSALSQTRIAAASRRDPFGNYVRPLISTRFGQWHSRGSRFFGNG